MNNHSKFNRHYEQTVASNRPSSLFPLPLAEVFSPHPTDPHSAAFTLAEVLITLGFIGVVAALTLPSLMNNIQDKQYKSAFKKQISVFSQAMQRVYLDDGETYTTVNWSQMPIYLCKIQKELKVVKAGTTCNDNNEWVSTGQFYWHKDNEWFNKKGNPQNLNKSYMPNTFILPDGAIVNYNCINQVFIDVNGYKKPNRIGKDIFYFTLNNKKVLPEFFGDNDRITPNACTIDGQNSTPNLSKTNYEEDCKSGSGWGCSPLYILE